MPPAAKFTTGNFLSFFISFSTSYGAENSFARDISWFLSLEIILFIPSVMLLICLTASITFPVPASPFVRIIAAPSPILLQASPIFVAPLTNGVLISCLSIWFLSSAGVNTSLSSIKSIPNSSNICASTK